VVVEAAVEPALARVVLTANAHPSREDGRLRVLEEQPLEGVHVARAEGHDEAIHQRPRDTRRTRRTARLRQTLAPAMERHLHRALAGREDLGDLQVGQIEGLLQHDGDAFAGREREHALGGVAKLGLLLRVLGARVHAILLGAARRLGAGPATLVDPQIGENAQQVGAGAPDVAPVHGQGAEGSQQTILDQVLGIEGVAGQAAGEAEQTGTQGSGVLDEGVPRGLQAGFRILGEEGLGHGALLVVRSSDG
jgi:hypothetical protein